MEFVGLWMAFSFAVTIAASSFVVGRVGAGVGRLGKMQPPNSAEVEALRKKLAAKCSEYECEEYREPNSKYCIAHRDKNCKAGAQ